MAVLPADDKIIREEPKTQTMVLLHLQIIKVRGFPSASSSRVASELWLNLAFICRKTLFVGKWKPMFPPDDMAVAERP